MALTACLDFWRRENKSRVPAGIRAPNLPDRKGGKEKRYAAVMTDGVMAEIRTRYLMNMTLLRPTQHGHATKIQREVIRKAFALCRYVNT